MRSGHFVYHRGGGTINANAIGAEQKIKPAKPVRRCRLTPEQCQQIAEALRQRKPKYLVMAEFKLSRITLDFVEGEMLLGRYGGWGCP